MRYAHQTAEGASSRETPRNGHENVSEDPSAEDDDRAAAVIRQFESRADAAAYADLYEGSGPPARYFHSRLHAVLDALSRCPGGELLDLGCGPGLLINRIAAERPGDFHFTACDQSPGMVAEAVRANRGLHLTAINARAEQLPMATGSFDAVVATGLLEYTNRPLALAEISRVVRPGGLVVLTMLNPLSPYRLFEWTFYWPLLRRLGKAEAMFGIPVGKRHGAAVTGIRSVPAFRLKQEMRSVGMRPYDMIHYDLNALLPPIDRFARRSDTRWRDHPESTVSRGPQPWMGTGYLIAARAVARVLAPGQKQSSRGRHAKGAARATV
jgi:ubiquinone/menaquinone biosynthesis C-methylase UbiE